ncbi:flavin reductase [Nocardioides massiliensis]|uniref:Flavin reductase (DIM6/NTAB) family NADH-FMN oxidoreductase RutF n=1 Tax=Nocardioides massiliensis TaxID=1325935 RepID=A0ABT9NTN9_9ACTN|nr:flavin reductase [Nocardioides massiliensis]MDP9823544.1 flavin reductase (DIM6/NTAB) family NADH-FMN oxidoreductase RutF [Nocardioides massiliensis]
MTIHTTHPFADPSGDRDPARRLRGRLGGVVMLWTHGELAARTAVGLTVSSLMVAGGEPATVLGLVDPDSDLAAELEVGTPYAVSLLEWRHRDLAEVFAGLAPSPGGPFATGTWEQTAAGPVPRGVRDHAVARVSSLREVGWSMLVEADLEEVVVADGEPESADTAPLVHRRGRYQRPPEETR